MKKAVTIVFALLMLCSAVVSAEAGDASGLWYASVNGIELELSLNEDGTGTMTYLVYGITAEYTWELMDGSVILNNGSETTVLAYDGDKLTITDGETDIVFTRERGEMPTVADPVADAPVEVFAGDWESGLCGHDGMIYDGSALGEIITVSIDGTDVTLVSGYTFYDGTVFECEYADGRLTYVSDAESDSIFHIRSLEVQALEDGTIAITFGFGDGGAQTFYMVPAEAAEEAA